MNLLIPIASSSQFFKIEEYGYPKSLFEILGKPMLQHVIENLNMGNAFKKNIFILQDNDCIKYHLDSTIKLISPTSTSIFKLRSNTQGALCSILWAIDEINNDEPLFISNADQIFTNGVSDQIQNFLRSDLDAGCITINSTHPRWSYVRLNSNNEVIETAEKNPISKIAIAGLYMYRKGSDFVKFGLQSIKNDASVEGNFYIAPIFNEMILAHKKIGAYSIDNSTYHTFYTPQKIEEYETQLLQKLI